MDRLEQLIPIFLLLIALPICFWKVRAIHRSVQQARIETKEGLREPNDAEKAEIASLLSRERGKYFCALVITGVILILGLYFTFKLMGWIPIQDHSN